MNESHIHAELRGKQKDTPQHGIVLPNISVFAQQSFFENEKQPHPRRGFGSQFVQHKPNSRDWPTGFYCLVCKHKNITGTGGWGKAYPNLAALLSHGCGSNCIPIAYLCLLRKQYRWHKDKLTEFLIKENFFVGSDPVQDKTRHPDAFQTKIWCIVTTHGSVDD